MNAKRIIISLSVFLILVFATMLEAQDNKSLKIVSSSLNHPIISPLKVKPRARYLFIQKPLLKKQKLILKKVSMSFDAFKRFSGINRTAKIKHHSKFPFKAYFLLLSKKKKPQQKQLVYSDCFIPGNGVYKEAPSKDLKVKIIFKADLENAKKDVSSYAIVYLDKKRIGVTRQNLLSQEKSYTFKTNYKKHILKLVIYIQDPLRRRWRRLRNIHQPAPKYFKADPKAGELVLVVSYFPDKRIGRYAYEGFYKR